ncbi:hypothetical protein CFB48_13550 [Burkholderia sp. AU33647]|nr:hypothetical protein CFB48_13550 [Burkholderia sp. AU33647]
MRSLPSHCPRTAPEEGAWIKRMFARSERDGGRAVYNHAEYLHERRKMMRCQLRGLTEGTKWGQCAVHKPDATIRPFGLQCHQSVSNGIP